MKKHQKYLEQLTQNIRVDVRTKKYFIEKDNINGRVIQCELEKGIEMFFFDYKIKEEQEMKNFESENILEIFYCLTGGIEMKYGEHKVELKDNHIGIYDLNHCPDKVILRRGAVKGISLILNLGSADQVIEKYMAGRSNVMRMLQSRLSVQSKLFMAFGNKNLKSAFLGIVENPFDFDREYLLLKAMELILISIKTMEQRESESFDQEPSKEFAMFCKAKDYMEIHMADPITVSDIAYDVGGSVGAVNRIFSRYANQTAYGYLKEIRLKQAKELLLQSDCSVTEIAVEVGWSNASKFSIAFRKKYGDSPVDFRNIYKIVP